MHKILAIVTLLSVACMTNCNKPQNDLVKEKQEELAVQPAPVMEEKPAAELEKPTEQKAANKGNRDAAGRIINQYNQRITLTADQEMAIAEMVKGANIDGMEKAARQTAMRQVRSRINQEVLTAEQRTALGL